MAEGLNRTLSNRLAKKKVEMLGYATSSLGRCSRHRLSNKYKRRSKQLSRH